MNQHTTSNFANRFASKKLFASVLAATFILGFGITVSVSFAGIEAQPMLLDTGAANIRTNTGECQGAGHHPDEICKEICLDSGQGQPTPTDTFQCAMPGQTTPN